jgi:membrane-bound serine protease (ClpP class)
VSTLPTRGWVPWTTPRPSGGDRTRRPAPDRRRTPRRRLAAAVLAVIAAAVGLLAGAAPPVGAQAGGPPAPAPAESGATASARAAATAADPGATAAAAAGAGAGAGATDTAGAAATASAGATDTAGAGQVSVVTLTGFIDPILADLVQRSVADAEAATARGLVFQVDLEGSVIPDTELLAMIDRVRHSPVPAHVWVGPTGSRLAGKAAWLATAAREVAMAPGTTIGGDVPPLAAAVDPALAARGEVLRNGPYDTAQARAAGITTVDAPTLGDFFVGLPGVEVRTVAQGDQTRREPVTRAVFSQLSLLSGFMHTAASPAVAYLLLAVGLSLLVFELFTAGVGVAGVIGAGSFVLSCYGLATLPTRGVGLALLVGSMVAFAIDVQTGVPRFWTATGLVLFTLGSFTVYDGVSMSWLTIAVGIGGVALAFLAGMPSMVRTRFSTPTIGREWMVGEEGRAISDIDPDGVVQVKGAPWRAYTNRATPIEALDRVRVIGIEGLVLEVEPTEGAARDYRHRSSSAATGDPPAGNS